MLPAELDDKDLLDIRSVLSYPRGVICIGLPHPLTRLSFIFSALILILCVTSQAGVYGNLEFGDSRDTVARKLKSSDLVVQTVDSTFLGRTGLNGVFKCKAKLAGLTYHLYFDWSENGGLKEVTLRSEQLHENEYGSTIKEAWVKANKLFTQVYNRPVQNANYPNKNDFNGHPVLITHMWHKGSNQSILIGPGLEKNQSFLTIRFVNKKIAPVRTP